MKKKKRLTFNAPIILSFVFICFGVTLLGMVTGGSSTQIFFMNYRSSLKNPLTYIRFVTHVFGHEGWSHFVGNMSYILLLGPILEEKYGGKIIAEIILMTSLTTGLINFIFFPSQALCGASGVVFAFILLISFTGFKDGEIPITFILVAIIFVGQQIYEGISVNDNISNLSHILGGIVGTMFEFIINKLSSREMKNKRYY